MTYIQASPDHWTNDMTHSVTVYKASSLDNYGKKTISGSGTAYDCHLISEVRNSRDDMGNEVVEQGRLYILSDANIEVGDRLDLPGSVADPRIITVKKLKYFNGSSDVVHHTVVTFGATLG